MVPNGWTCAQIDEIGEIQVGRDLKEENYSDVKTERYCYPVFSNTVENRGLYGYYDLPEYSGNSVTIVGRGIGLGTAFARPEGEGFGAIGRLLVLSPRNNSFDVRFLENYINHSLRIYNESGGIPQLPGTSLAKYTVVIPPINEQKKIAQILSTWDQAIASTERLLDLAHQQKRALMQQLLTGKKRLADKNGLRFFGDWNFLTFDGAFKVVNDKAAQVKSSEYLESGSAPIVDQGQKLIAGYCNSEKRYTNVPVIVFGDHTRCIKWIDFPFCPGADGTQVINTTELLAKKFGYYLLCNTDIPNLGYSRHMRELKEKDFKAPESLEEQEKISAVLSNVDQEIETLRSQLDALKQEKKALMQTLLTGKRRVSVDE